MRLSRVQVFTLLILVLGLGSAVAMRLVLPVLIENAYHGESFSHLNRYVADDRLEDPASRNLEHYLSLAVSIANRGLVLACTLCVLVGFIAVKFPDRVRNFFTHTQGPLNLAVFRIVAFYLALRFPIDSVVRLSQRPEGAMLPPPGWASLVSLFPSDPSVVRGVGVVFFVSCVLGFLGLFTRVVTPLAAATGLYFLGLPNFFGKIDHYHHVWLFLFLLSFAQSADTLSLDSLFRSTKAPPGESKIYTLPIRYAWLLIGLIYFFPGFWKFMISGPAWALSDNLKWKLHAKWLEVDYLPVFRIDEFPFLYKSGAVFTIAFEILFVFALFFPVGRLAFVACGLLFHNFTNLFMKISFFTLQVSYVIFVDWQWLLQAVAKRLYKTRLVVRYDSKDAAQLAWVNLLKTYDFSRTVDYSETQQASGVSYLIQGRELPAETRALSLARYFPLAWPFLFLGSGIQKLKSRFQKQITLRPARSDNRLVTVQHMAGGLVVLSMLACGFTLVDTWPVAVYPTFAALDKPHIPTIEIHALSQQDEIISRTIPFGDARLRSTTGSPTRFSAVTRRFLNSMSEKQRQAFTYQIVRRWKDQEPLLEEKARQIRVYEIHVSTDPDRLLEPVGEKRLIWKGPTPFDISVDAKTD